MGVLFLLDEQMSYSSSVIGKVEFCISKWPSQSHTALQDENFGPVAALETVDKEEIEAGGGDGAAQASALSVVYAEQPEADCDVLLTAQKQMPLVAKSGGSQAISSEFD